MDQHRDLIIVFGYRSVDEQNKLYEQGRSLPGNIVTNARGGKSPHNYYCAIDAWVMNKDGVSIDWANSTYKNIARDHALTCYDKIQWGGDFQTFVDMPHWELRRWRAVRDGYEKVIPNTI